MFNSTTPAKQIDFISIQDLLTAAYTRAFIGVALLSSRMSELNKLYFDLIGIIWKRRIIFFL